MFLFSQVLLTQRHTQKGQFVYKILITIFTPVSTVIVYTFIFMSQNLILVILYNKSLN